MKKKKVKLFIDLSSSDTGITVLDINRQETTTMHIKVNAFKNEHDKNIRAQLKIKDLDEKLDELIKNFDIEEVILEAPFVNSKFLLSSEMVLKVHGFVLHKFKDIKMKFITPSEIKKIVTGKGNASKDDVIKTLKKNYNLNFEGNNDNMFDSFALMIAYNKINEESIS